MPGHRRPPTEMNRTIGGNLRAIREFRGISQMALAEVLGISFQQLQKYEKGQNRISAERLHSLHRYFEVPYDYFFHGLHARPSADMELMRSDPAAVEAFQLMRKYRNLPQKKKILDIIRILTT